ncbi:unnamed protein product [Closterium sp. Naga37s-1]|nr:unnamed protein product [Closterium sp. Naga37s-1]
MTVTLSSLSSLACVFDFSAGSKQHCVSSRLNTPLPAPCPCLLCPLLFMSHCRPNDLPCRQQAAQTLRHLLTFPFHTLLSLLLCFLCPYCRRFTVGQMTFPADSNQPKLSLVASPKSHPLLHHPLCFPCLPASLPLSALPAPFRLTAGQMTFPADSKQPKLSVVFWPPPSTPSSPSSTATSQYTPASLPVDEPGLESVEMTASDGARYRCILPPPSLSSPPSPAGGAEGAGAKGGAAGVAFGESRKSPEDLLDAMKGLPCFYRQDGWWTYEFCYKKHIRQMHIEQQDGENKVTMDFVLGRYSARESLRAQRRLEATAAAGGGDVGKRYHVQVYTNGTACDLTGAGRRTEVRHVCEEGAQTFMGSIKEGPTCEYELALHTNLLCSHPLFRTVRQPIHFINCHQFPTLSSSPSTSADSALQPPPLDDIAGGTGEGGSQGEEEEEEGVEGEGEKREGVEGGGGVVVEGEEDGVLSFEYEGEEEEELIEVDPEVEEIEESLSAL